MESVREARRVLVLGRDNRSFLATIRSLGRRGVEVHVAWHEPRSSALESRYITRVHDLPAPQEETGPWFDALRDLLRAERFDLVLPTNDPATIALHARRLELEPLARIYLPSTKAIEVVFDKLATWELARSLGVPVPKQVPIAAGEHARAAAAGLPARLGWPVVLKPRASFAFGRLKWEGCARKANTPRELEDYLSTMLATGDVLAQENFVGAGVGVEVLAERGEVRLAFQHLRVHEPPLGGGSSYRRGVALEPELLGPVRELMRALEYTGVAMVELKCDPRTGAWVLIEVNGRFWGSLPLAVASGADFPWALYELLVEGRRPAASDTRAVRTDLYCRNLWMDFGWLLANRRANRADPTLCALPWFRVVRELAHPLLLRERIDTLCLDDPRPGGRELRRTIREARCVAAQKLRGALLGLGPVRRRRARAVGRVLADARCVLFVCKGNVCRSPFAERVARRLLPPEVEVVSAGYWGEGDRVCPGLALAVARSMGIHLDDHRSRVVDAELLRRADVVFVFDDENRRALSTVDPSVAPRVHSLGFLVARGPLEIKDPYGGDHGAFDAAYRAISDTLTAALDPARQHRTRLVESEPVQESAPSTLIGR